MSLSGEALQSAMRMIIKGQHYRKAVLLQISEDFLRFSMQFFKDVVYAKIEGIGIDEDWYKENFLSGKNSA